MLATDLVADAVLAGLPAAYCAPSYKMMLDVWRDAASALQPFAIRKSVQERRLELVTGGVLEFWSLDNADAIRGRKYARVVVDEAALVPYLMDIWQQIIRPTLVDYQGDAWFMSTPKGRNGFWQLWQLGQDEQQPDWRSWQMPTTANPYIPPAEVESARLESTELTFSQEYQALFLEDGGGVFRGVLQAATALPAEPPAACVFGVDWGKHNDFTVIVVMSTDGRMLAIDRFNQIDYAVQTQRLKALAERWQPVSIIAERNSMGEPIIEQLQRDGLPVQAFQTSNATKAVAIDALAMAFERGTITILNDPVLVGELQAYEMERLPSGLLRYNAPGGMHDDTVMALALAWTGVENSAPIVMW